MNEYKLISPHGHTVIVMGDMFTRDQIWVGDLWQARVPTDWLVIVTRGVDKK